MSADDAGGDAKRCICPGCPTYDECMRYAGQRYFCGVGSSPCGPRIEGCHCGQCPVWMDRGLSANYYCHEGPA